MFSSNNSQVSNDAVFVEDIFSTYLYTGNGSTQTITNGIDLAGKGGLVWIKSRQASGAGNDHVLVTNGLSGVLRTNLTNAISGYAGDLASQSSTGFSVNTDFSGGTWYYTNGPTIPYASWTFRKQPKFFDVVTYTGNGTARTIAHNLGSAPGFYIVKRTDTTSNWSCYHRSLGNGGLIDLNSTGDASLGNGRWNFTSPTSTVFSVSDDPSVNGSGGTYVAYLFAHDAGGFGLTGTDNVISCGSYTGNGSTVGPTVTLGYEPQFVMIKRTDSTSNWMMFDTARGMALTGNTAELDANLSGSESAGGGVYIALNATGFQIVNSWTGINASGGTYIYIAIRRGPMKVPTSGTSVFSPIARAGTSATANVSTGFVTDAAIIKIRSGGFVAEMYDRLRGANKRLYPDQTSAESTTTDHLTSFATNDGYTLGASASGEVNLSGYNYANWNFRRAPSFFDEVCYTGTGSATTFTHNLGVAPELIIVKGRSGARAWTIYHSSLGATKYIEFNTSAAFVSSTRWNDTAPTSSVFTVGTAAGTNVSTETYVAYLFATCAGVSKVGSYTGTGTTKQIDCGFTGGARFVLIKRTDSTGDWYVWDSVRGIVSGNDPYLLLNSTAAEVTSTDYIDTYSAGFEISSTAPAAINASGGTFIFLAIA